VRDVCHHVSSTLMDATLSFRVSRPLPWRVRWQLRRLAACPRAVAESSGLKEWSDRELARLQPGWIKAFLRRHVVRCAVLALLYLVALAFLGASFERYWHWLQTVEVVAGEPVRTVDRWTAFCRVQPWTRACRPTPRPGTRDVAPAIAPGVGAGTVLGPHPVERQPGPTFADL
jgi:hypothetical protein